MSNGTVSGLLPHLRHRSPRSRSGTRWRASSRDQSTGLLNASALGSAGASIMRATDRRGEPISAVVIRCVPARDSSEPDDPFWSEVVDVVRSTFDHGELIVRDGWELIVLLPSTDEPGAVGACARLAGVLEGVDGRGGVVLFGAATRPPGHEYDLAHLLERARGRVDEESERNDRRGARS
jgi:hypothetical protein